LVDLYGCRMICCLVHEHVIWLLCMVVLRFVLYGCLMILLICMVVLMCLFRSRDHDLE
jgi:hypothetical protein